MEILCSAKYAFVSSQGKESSMVFLSHLTLLIILSVKIKIHCQKMAIEECSAFDQCDNIDTIAVSSANRIHRSKALGCKNY